MPIPAKAKLKASKSVLVVDDNAAIRAQVRQLFLSDGFTLCGEAENGLKALEVAAECKPDVIILDLAMPVMNGIEAAPKLKELLPDAIIIFFTLHGDYLKHVDTARLGVSATVCKGGSLRVLIEKAQELMDQ